MQSVGFVRLIAPLLILQSVGKFSSFCLSVDVVSERSNAITDNVRGLCVRAEFEKQKLNNIMKQNRNTEVESLQVSPPDAKPMLN